MPDRCFIAWLNNRTRLLRERSGPGSGVGQDRGRDRCGENAGTRRTHRASHRTLQAGSVHWEPPVVPLSPHLTSYMAVAGSALVAYLPVWFDLAAKSRTAAAARGIGTAVALPVIRRAPAARGRRPLACPFAGRSRSAA